MFPLDKLKQQRDSLKAKGCDTSILDKAIAEHESKANSSEASLWARQAEARRQRGL